MILGSHNSWSYLPPTDWWMRIYRFAARCQDWDIKTQYEHGVRCFDLRVKFIEGLPYFVHNIFMYDYSPEEMEQDLKWLNDKGDVYIRVSLDVRTKKVIEQAKNFTAYCRHLEETFSNIAFCGGNELYKGENLYNFDNSPSFEEHYSSVEGSKLNGLFPRRWAKKHNKRIYDKGTDKQILMLDFVNYVA